MAFVVLIVVMVVTLLLPGASVSLWLKLNSEVRSREVT